MASLRDQWIYKRLKIRFILRWYNCAHLGVIGEAHSECNGSSANERFQKATLTELCVEHATHACSATSFTNPFNLIVWFIMVSGMFEGLKFLTLCESETVSKVCKVYRLPVCENFSFWVVIRLYDAVVVRSMISYYWHVVLSSSSLIYWVYAFLWCL